MRQFILGAGDVAYATGATPELAASGAVGFYYLKDGKLTVSTTGVEMKGEGAIVLGRTSAEGGPVILPFYNNHFSFVKSSYKAAKTFVANFTIPNVTVMEDHSVIFIKKGVQFNERANWTATVHAYKTSETVNMIAKKIADYVNNNPLLGLTAVTNAAKVTVTATKPGVDYELVPADALLGMEVIYSTRGEAALNDAEGIKKLADMAAADAGIEYTYRDSYVYLYPNYPLDPLAQPKKTDYGFTVFTLRFAVPRATKTRDEVVHQIVQIAIPNKSASTVGDAVTAIETALKAMAKL